MTATNSTFHPDWVSPPGDTILERLTECDISRQQLADKLNLALYQVHQLVAGTLPITRELAERLHKTIGGSTAFWVQREAQYRASDRAPAAAENSRACPNADAILAYAARIGVKHAELVYEELIGWSLLGEGRQRYAGGSRPLVWKVCYDCGMACGGGSSNKIQINPTKFKLPS